MPVAPQDRPITALREETIDQLIMNYGHGKLSLEAFERRLDQALDTDSHEALLALTSDLDLVTDKTYTEKKRAELGMPTAPPAPPARDVDFMIHIFGGGSRGGAWTVPKEIWVLSVFGGGELDFTHARFSARETRIRMLCLFGGAEFFVTENINTVSRALCIFGGIDNRAPSTSEPNAPTLVIDGLVLFGGAGIKVKRSLKERWLQFADSVRDAFGSPAEPHTRRDERLARRRFRAAR